MKKLFVCITMACVFVVPSIYAQSQSQKKHSFEIAPEISVINYKERGLMENEGMMYGVTMAYTYRGWLPSTTEENGSGMIRLEGRGSFGEVDYDSIGTGSIEGINDYIYETRLLLGGDVNISEKCNITPYFGGGYRYLNDDSSNKVSTTRHLGYEREISYAYTPIGLEVTFLLNDAWYLGVTGEYDYFWRGTVKSHLDDAGANYKEMTNKQDKGYGCRGSIKIGKKGDLFNFAFEPFVRYWRIQKSNEVDFSYNDVIIGKAYEPKNYSTEYGVAFNIGF